MMRHVLPVAAACVLILVVACDEQSTDPTLEVPTEPRAAISDALQGVDRNPGFFWLPPMVPQPPRASLGVFEPRLNPTIKVVCLTATLPAVDCDPTFAIAEFGIGSGMVVDPAGQYQVDLDTDVWPLRPVAEGDTTTYRIIAHTDSLAALGGPFVLGYADVVVAATGREARRLSTDELIGLVDGQTLPIKFRLEEGAYEHELAANLATVPGDPDGPLCQENCSVTVVSSTEPTEATLVDDETGEEVTGARFEAGDVATSSLLVIDERTTADEGEETCATGVTVNKRFCYRYKVFPDEPFVNPVRFGICPRDLPIGDGSTWRIMKVDKDASGQATVTRPPPVDVSDFLPCAGLGGISAASPLRSLVRYAFDWLVPPLLADDDEEKVWGGMAEDFSDVFWGEDAELSAASPTDTTLTAGAVSPTSVLVRATSPEPDSALAGAEVVFTITEGLGSLSTPTGATSASDSTAPDGRVVRMRLLTGSDGKATVNWAVAAGDNSLEATSPDAVTADLEPIVFTVTGVGQADLTVTDVWTGLHGANLSDGVLIHGHMQNQGNAPAPPTLTELRLRELNTGERLTLAQATPSLAAGQFDTTSVIALLVGGTWATTMNADYNDAVAELDETNNSASDTLVSGTPLSYEIVSTGLASHTCALADGGAAYCWGSASAGQTGRDDSQLLCGAEACDLRPVPVQGGFSFSQLAVGTSHSCGLVGTAAYCWGSNTTSALGNNGPSVQTTPAPVVDPATGPVAYTKLSAGNNHTCGLTVDGDIYCWGTNLAGQLGYGGNGGSSATPLLVQRDSSVTFTDVAAGSEFTCAIGSNLRAYCWGRGHLGQVGPNTEDTCFFGEPCAVTPAVVHDSIFFQDIATGGLHACGVDTSGRAWCWGENVYGQLGATTNDTCTTSAFACSRVPLMASGGLTYQDIEVGYRHSCGAAANGDAYCWGANSSGSLGDGSLSHRAAPTLVADPLSGEANHAPDPHTVQYTAITAGNAHSCGLTADGYVYCWGTGDRGQLGRSVRSQQRVPGRIYEPLP